MAACEGRVVSEIVVTSRDPTIPALPSGLRWVGSVMDGLHATTIPRVVERFLLLRVGEPCSERRRAESERILRLQPFLSDATVRAEPDPSGGTRIEVETVDEISPEIRMRFRGGRPTALRFGNGNVAGRGLDLSGSVERGFEYRTGWGVHATAYQIFGRPYTMSLVVDREPLGGSLAFSLGYPFLTEQQRGAWYTGYQDVHRYVAFARPLAEDLSLQLQRRAWSLGGVRRFGIGRESAFLGALLTHEDVAPAANAVIVSDSGLIADTTGALGDPYRSYRNVRINAVLGARMLSFMQARGFDALMATEDVATGVQLGVVVGRGMPQLGSAANDLLVSTDLYAGLGSTRSLVTVRVAAEARRDHRGDRWDSMIGSGRVAWYVKPAREHVVVSSLEMAGGMRSRVPFQLRMSDPQGGMRGYAASRAGGAARGIARLEHRWLLGAVGANAGFGLASFVDLGRVWEGDAPIGSDNGVGAGAGLGLLVAFPPESTRTWRLDFAVPLSRDPDAHWEVRLTGLRMRSFWHEPDDIARARAEASPSRIFRW